MLGTMSAEYETLEKSQALAKVNKIASSGDFSHNLGKLMRLLEKKNVLSKIQISKTIEGYSGEDLIKILENAYLESRYPVPEPTFRKYPISRGSSSKMYSDPLQETAPIKYAREIASTIVMKIASDFSFPSPPEKLLSHISDKNWARFCRLMQLETPSG